MADVSKVAAACRWQADACRSTGSPFAGALLDRVAADVDAAGPFAALMAPWAGRSARALLVDAVPIRLLGALHDLALEGVEPAVTARYPAAEPRTDWDALWPRLRAAATDHPERLTAFMGHEPQTNEVRRSACLLPGFLTAAAETALPLRCLEVGASAGLNQSWDAFAYRLGETRWGDPASPLLIETDWRGPPPPTPAVQVLERRACDRRPIDIRDPVQRRRLTAYVWADQLDRLARLERAIEIALARDVRIDTADAAEWAETHARPQAGAATVVYHSVFQQYLPDATRERLFAALEAAGAAASLEAPFAWLRMEPTMTDDYTTMAVDLTLWPGGKIRRLARVHPHGAWIESGAGATTPG